MENNTHSAHILGENFSAFIDGIPDTCEHQWNGRPYEIISSKEEIDIHQLSPENETIEDLYKRDLALREQGKWISGGGVTCSKCGKYFSPPMFDI